MVTIETRAHVSSDGILRLEVPVPERDQDVEVVLVVNADAGKPERHDASDPLQRLREKVARDPEAAAGLTLAESGSVGYTPFEPIDLPGPSASEILIRDRR